MLLTILLGCMLCVVAEYLPIVFFAVVLLPAAYLLTYAGTFVSLATYALIAFGILTVVRVHWFLTTQPRYIVIPGIAAWGGTLILLLDLWVGRY